MRLGFFAAMNAMLVVTAWAGPVPSWRLARSQHFEIYAQSSDDRALAILHHFEQLRAFFLRQSPWKTAAPLPVRVIVFASPEEYQPYRLRATSDAYYVGSGDRDYIVMSGADTADFAIAAHEYGHLILRASNLRLPPWLKEGVAEVYSTLEIGADSTRLGGPLPARLDTLRKRAWIPLGELMALSDDSFRQQERSTADLFYAESWALAGMLELSPSYAAGFQQLIAAAGVGSQGIDVLTRDLRRWVDAGASATVQLPRVASDSAAVEVSGVSPLQSRLVLAQLLLTAGEFDRAQTLFAAMPDSAEVSAALGTIALHRGDLNTARLAWQKAIAEGIGDAQLCYHYAILADGAGLSPDDIRPALERAIALDPGFDDARYQLALLHKNAGRYEQALEQLQAMRVVPDERAYAYWMALADVFNELGRREEAQTAAGQAAGHAITAAERARASEQIYLAQTDPGVQFARDASGRLQLVTTRMPHQTADWNPFIEPGDDLQRVQGELREIECGKTTTIRVEAGGRLLTLAIPDLQHVQMRHAPPEFTCGPQKPTPVTIEFARAQKKTSAGASQGVVRGMAFE